MKVYIYYIMTLSTKKLCFKVKLSTIINYQYLKVIIFKNNLYNINKNQFA